MLFSDNRVAVEFVNLALNQPTWQSSTYSTFYSYLGADGNHETDCLNTQLCAQVLTRENETLPWWAVDLGAPTYVYGVNSTCCGW
jgi:hypothetical protein